VSGDAGYVYLVGISCLRSLMDLSYLIERRCWKPHVMSDIGGPDEMREIGGASMR
jgi:hypothetical protein